MHCTHGDELVYMYMAREMSGGVGNAFLIRIICTCGNMVYAPACMLHNGSDAQLITGEY